MNDDMVYKAFGIFFIVFAACVAAVIVMGTIYLGHSLIQSW